MIKREFTLGQSPCVLYGSPCERAFLCVHGQCGNKEEAEGFAQIAQAHGWQTLALDLPEHGARRGDGTPLRAWTVEPELDAVMTYLKNNYSAVALRAGSIGAWLCLTLLQNETFSACQLVAPLLDMPHVIHGMMRQADVSVARLKREARIQTANGVLTIEEWRYAQAHPVTRWQSPTAILYPERDHLTPIATARAFAARFSCALTVLPGSEHYIHTPEQVAFLNEWTQAQFVSQARKD